MKKYKNNLLIILFSIIFAICLEFLFNIPYFSLTSSNKGTHELEYSIKETKKKKKVTVIVNNKYISKLKIKYKSKKRCTYKSAVYV